LKQGDGDPLRKPDPEVVPDLRRDCVVVGSVYVSKLTSAYRVMDVTDICLPVTGW